METFQLVICGIALIAHLSLAVTLPDNLPYKEIFKALMTYWVKASITAAAVAVPISFAAPMLWVFGREYLGDVPEILSVVSITQVPAFFLFLWIFKSLHRGWIAYFATLVLTISMCGPLISYEFKAERFIYIAGAYIVGLLVLAIGERILRWFQNFDISSGKPTPAAEAV